MSKKKNRRQKAIMKRNLFVAFLCIVLALIIGIIVSVVTGPSDEKVKEKPNTEQSQSIEENPETEENKEEEVKEEKEEEPENDVKPTDKNDGNKLDPNFEMLLLVNGKNPLPKDYDAKIRKDLVTIDKKYRNNNNVTDIHKDVYPYITAMVKAAQAEGVDLRVWSPFRSYATQNILFQNQVKRVGGDEDLAATVVARPGTSEHNTGICADFNMASDAFEKTKMYKWMVENAEDYGFVLRYPKDKTDITGVIYESWHWRFVGINRAKEMNNLGFCLEEYIEYLNNNE